MRIDAGNMLKPGMVTEESWHCYRGDHLDWNIENISKEMLPRVGATASQKACFIDERRCDVGGDYSPYFVR